MIEILDLNFLGSKETIAAFLVPSSEGYLLFETGPYSTFETLKNELTKRGVALSDIKHVFLTHIHFDHAGAAWALAENGATIYVHPYGEKHLHQPEKLYNSAKRIYQDKMEYLWGRMEGIPSQQLKTVAHEEILTIGDVTLKALHTPGHAVHHIAWKIGNEIITGDVGGVKINDGVVVPPCPPPDINVEDWQNSIRILRDENATALYLTHFGRVSDIYAHLTQLEAQLLDWANWMKPYYEAQTDPATVTTKFQAYVKTQLINSGIQSELELEKYEKANPSWMSVSGLMRYWKKRSV